MKNKVHNHMTSLRLPIEWHAWIAQFAESWHTTPAYIYRSAVIEFIKQRQSPVRDR